LADPTVFIVDPDTAAQSAIAQLVATMGLSAERFDSPQTFVTAVDITRPGCAVLEFHQSGESGLEFQKRLAEQGYSLPIIFVSAYGDMPTAVTAMKAGAIDFMAKPFRVHELYDAIQHALEQDAIQRSKAAAKQDLAARFARLTPGEKRVLELIVAGRRKQEIATDLGLSVRTIEVRRSKVMKKLQATTLADLIRTVLSMTEHA
jgi:FixJ family two-component response regulator